MYKCNSGMGMEAFDEQECDTLANFKERIERREIKEKKKERRTRETKLLRSDL